MAASGQEMSTLMTAHIRAESDDDAGNSELDEAQIEKLFGLPWDELPFVSTSDQDPTSSDLPRITVSASQHLSESFGAPATYQGKHFSTCSVTGASITASKVVTITVPADLLNLSDDAAERLLKLVDEKRLELGLDEDTAGKVPDYCASYEEHRASILNWAIIQSCFNFAKSSYEDETLCRIVLPAGTYEVSSIALGECFHIYSNTWLDMTAGTKLVHLSHKVCMLRNASSKTSLSGYEHRNIILDGGTWVGLNNTLAHHDEVAICHAKNVVVRNATFDGCTGAHHLELVGVSGATITGCEFKGYTGNADKEAIQLDVAGSASASSFKANDLTVTQNVVICNNYFHDVSRGVGTHYAYIGYPNHEVLIQNNTFERLKSTAVLLVSFKNAAIVRNTMKSCPDAIQILPALNGSSYYTRTSKSYTTCKNYLIEGNTITTANNSSDTIAAITIYGNRVGSTLYKLSNAMLKNNTVNACNIALTLSRTSGIIVTGEEYASNTKYCMLAHKEAKATISNSSFTSTKGSGIKALTGCELLLTKCTMTNCKLHGVHADEATIAANGCAFKANAKSGLHAKSSTLSLSSCALKSNKGFGIYANTSELTLKKGSAKANKKDGIRAVSSTLRTTGFKSASNKACGIRAASTTTTINKTACSKNKAQGVYLVSSSASIKKSTFKSNKKNGLLAANKSTVKTLKKNMFTKNGKYGVHCTGKSNIKKKSGNKLSSNKKGGIHA